MGNQMHLDLSKYAQDIHSTVDLDWICTPVWPQPDPR